MIAVLCAMKSELAEVVSRMSEVEVFEHLEREYHLGKIAGRDVVAAECGIGKVASAVVCAMMIEKYHPELLINVGVAGGCRDFENTMDVVIADQLTYHDWNNLVINDQPNGFAHNQYVFESDREINELAVRAFPENCRSRIYVGPIVSGDTFVTLRQDVDRILKDYSEAYACDMESASIAHCCSAYQTGYLILRSLSDIVIRENNGLDFVEFCQRAAAQAAELLVNFIRLYSERK
ncbi:MAG: 5'-methylthioadenosine/adenosylhomocysteine nucleosidase [Erysipelotrichaceae bacterium]|nr:5'-methylthioadenosine/adenosylhomocysteine nucleosidase [Erysipelotrichaceae bacterium]